jgi:hypothetical protein
MSSTIFVLFAIYCRSQRFVKAKKVLPFFTSIHGLDHANIFVVGIAFGLFSSVEPVLCVHHFCPKNSFDLSLTHVLAYYRSNYAMSDILFPRVSALVSVKVNLLRI